MDIQGHRGCRGLMPENSMQAFNKAIELGVTTLEMDVVISKDYQVVVSHEPYMNHEITLKPDGTKILAEFEKDYNLYEMPYDSIKQFDCGSKPHPGFPNQKKIRVSKPLLSEVIELSEEQSNKSINYNIEIKSRPEYDAIYTPKVSKFVELVLDVLISKKVVKRTTLQSFDLRALEEIHKQNPNIQTALLIDENESINQKLSSLSFKPIILSPYYKLLDQDNVIYYQEKDFRIIPWTVNRTKDISKVIKLGVDGIITDFPDRFEN